MLKRIMKHNFLKLEIWKKGRKLVKSIYVLSQKFPKEELFGLTSQVRRAAVSVPSNIAEGCGRGTDKQLSHFIDIAIGSICELETQFYLAFDLEYISASEQQNIIDEIISIRKMMFNFKKRLG